MNGDEQIMSHLQFEAECCGVVFRCHVLAAVMGSGEPPVGKCVLAEVGKWYRESYRKREKDAVVSSQTRGAWNGARSMGFGISRQAWGALFYVRKFSGQRLFQTRQGFLVSFVATDHHFRLPDVSTSVSQPFSTSSTLQQ